MRSSVKNKIIWTIALPIIFGNLAQTLIALTDTAFLGRVSAVALDRKSTRLNSSHVALSRMPSSA